MSNKIKEIKKTRINKKAEFNTPSITDRFKLTRLFNDNSL